MELLEFKHKMFDLCGVSEISEIRDVLFNAVLSQDVAIFDGYNSIIDDTKDCRLSWLMNEDGSDYWKLTICFATFNVKYTEEVDCLLRTFCVNVKRKEILDE